MFARILAAATLLTLEPQELRPQREQQHDRERQQGGGGEDPAEHDGASLF